MAVESFPVSAIGTEKPLTVGDIIHFADGQFRILNIAASRIVGRKSSGEVVGLTAAEAQVIVSDSIVTYGDEVVSHKGNVVTN